MNSIVLEEWKELRSEIARKQAFAERILVSVAGINFAIIAYGIRDCAIEGIAVCLLPTIVSSVAYLWLLSYIYSGFRIAAYIKEVLEPKIKGFQWESWLSDNASKSKFPIRNSYSLVTNTFFVISLAAALLKIALLYIGQNPPPYPGAILVIIVVAFWGIYIIGIEFLFIKRAVKSINNTHREIDAD